MIARPNAQDASRAAVIQSAVVLCWKPGRWLGHFARGELVTFSLIFPQQQNGDILSTKEVRVMSARTVLISGNELSALT